MILGKQGLQKVSFKDCTLKENLISSFTDKFENDVNFYPALIKEITL